MTKTEFISELTLQLKKRNIADYADIIEEYEQHFAYKLSDGFSEEEICAKLLDPKTLAEQFVSADSSKPHSNAFLTWLWLIWADLFFGIFSILLIAWGIVMAACVISFGVIGISLILNLGSLPYITLPQMPYWCGAILGLSLLSLSVLSVCATVWFFKFIRQLFRFYSRFHSNTLSSAKGGAVLPSLPIAPQAELKTKRRLRKTALISLTLFAVCFVLSYIVCTISAGSFEFWHVWKWFN